VNDSLTYLFGLEYFGLKLGLDNIRTVLDGLGHPERSFRTVHIAGTNGKGSVAAMVAAVLQAAGHRTGRYTSPHLLHLNERFVIDGAPIDDVEIGRTLEDVRTVVQRLRDQGRLDVQPTFFEATTAIAFELFRRLDVGVAAIEVGLGGRLDATNVVTPLVTVITSIALDHQEHLGHTLRDIAIEKAGIIKPGVPVVVGQIEADALDEIRRIAGERGADMIQASDGVSVSASAPYSAGQAIRLRTPEDDYGELTLALAGEHQVRNAVIAVRALELVRAGGLAIPRTAIAAGLKNVTWPGRLDTRRLADGREALLDAAHNPEGAAALAAHLRRLPDRPQVLVFGATEDKDASGMLRALLPLVRACVITRASNRRSGDPERLAQLARQLAPTVAAQVAPDPAAALDAAWHIARKIVVAGSIFLLADVLPHLP
jgi:dihydrofolate synthase/folylpolyglutamate synthase